MSSGALETGDTYFRTCGHYHRSRELNGRVRNGNACNLAGNRRKTTSRPVRAKRSTTGRVRVACGLSAKAPTARVLQGNPKLSQLLEAALIASRDRRSRESPISVAKHSPVSTGRLSISLCGLRSGLSTGRLPAGFRAIAHRELILRKASCFRCSQHLS